MGKIDVRGKSSTIIVMPVITIFLSNSAFIESHKSHSNLLKIKEQGWG
jgi:hypothetical protein